MFRKIIYFFLFPAFMLACQKEEKGTEVKTKNQVLTIQVSSMAFTNGGTIPEKYTCDGQNVSPALSWSGIPQGTKTIALIYEDPDAPMRTWVHWVLYNLPADITHLMEGTPNHEVLDDGANQGKNDFHKIGYGGPCPPRGSTHRYFFKVYALDSEIKLDGGATKKELVKAMAGHILAEGQLMGKYGR